MDNVFHPAQVRELGTVFRLNTDLRRVEYFNWSLAMWDGVGHVFTPYPETRPMKQWRYLRNRGTGVASLRTGYSVTTYGKTYLEPIYEGRPS